MNSSHVLSDKIVRDGLAAIALADTDKSFYVGGGTAVQLQTPVEFHRPTSDIDTTFNSALNYAQFKKIVAPSVEVLQELGYGCNLEKNRQHFDVVYCRGDDVHLLQASRRSSANFERNIFEISRELEHAVDVEFQGLNLKVLSPEDITLHKARRICVFVDKYGISFLRKEDSHEDQRDYLMNKRKQAAISFDQFSPEEVAHMRLQADLYDIGLLLDYANFNESVYRKAASHENIFKRDLSKSKKILNSIDQRLDF